MASVDVNAMSAFPINWAPATEADEIVQNVAFIISAPSFSIPLARAIGAGDSVDAPMSQTKAVVRTNVYRAISRFEPRATVKEINLDESDVLNGQMRPRVRIDI